MGAFSCSNVRRGRDRSIQASPKDGIELVDDVGGVHGFCEMLRTIYDYDSTSEEAEVKGKDMLEWADMMGWTGRNISPKQTL